LIERPRTDEVHTLYLSAFVQMLSRPARLGYPCTHAGSCSLVPLSSPSLVCRLVRSRAQRRRHSFMQQAGVCVRTAHSHHSVRTVGEWVRTVVVVETALAIRSDVSISSPTTDDGRRSKPNSLFRDTAHSNVRRTHVTEPKRAYQERFSHVLLLLLYY
jgi:hypothetical protein